MTFSRGTGAEIDAIKFARKVVHATDVSLTQCPVKSLYIGNFHQLYATIAPANTTNKSIIWSSSDTAVARVDSMGLVSAISTGTAVITVVTADGNYTDMCTLKVVRQPVHVASVEMENCPITEMQAGSVTRLRAVIAPLNADDPAVHWTSSDPEVVSVDSDGWITSVSEGTASVSVTTVDGGLTATCMITVVSKVIGARSVLIDNCPLEAIYQGDTLHRLMAIIEPVDATNKSVIWHSSDTSVVKVDSGGVITATGPGTATVTVLTHNGYDYDQCTITVLAATNNTKKFEAGEMVEIQTGPAGESICFRFRETGIEKHIKIYNLFGQLLFQQDTDRANLEIGIGEIRTGGMVIVQVSSGMQSYSSKLILAN